MNTHCFCFRSWISFQILGRELFTRVKMPLCWVVSNKGIHAVFETITLFGFCEFQPDPARSAQLCIDFRNSHTHLRFQLHVNVFTSNHYIAEFDIPCVMSSCRNRGKFNEYKDLDAFESQNSYEYILVEVGDLTFAGQAERESTSGRARRSSSSTCTREGMRCCTTYASVW